VDLVNYPPDSERLEQKTPTGHLIISKMADQGDHDGDG